MASYVLPKRPKAGPAGPAVAAPSGGFIKNKDMRALRGYIMAHDGHEYDNVGGDSVLVHVSHNYLRAKFPDIRLNLHMTIAAVKDKLYTHCGTAPDWQSLILKDDGKPLCELDDETKKLGFYSVQSGMEIRVIDSDPHSRAKGGGLEDVSQVKKYVMSEEDYDKRKGTLRSYARDQVAKDPNFKFFGKFKPRFQQEQEAKEGKVERGIAEFKDVEGMKVGDRCECQPGNRRGKVVFIDETFFAPGVWVGVEFDEPVGKHTGTVAGKKYFECPDKHGAFLHPKNLEVGDFPEIDLMAELDSDSDEDEL
jgi:tubulin-folding cofactor B